MKLVAYIRISSHGQKDKGDSLDGQRQYIKSWALTGKHTIKKWYIDEAVSAFKGKRLNFELMLDELDSGLVQADAVIVYSLSRFSRNLAAFFKVVVIIRLVIKRLFFLDLDEPHQRVHSSLSCLTNALGVALLLPTTHPNDVLKSRYLYHCDALMA